MTDTMTGTMTGSDGDDRLAEEFRDSAARLLARHSTAANPAQTQPAPLREAWRAAGDAGWFRILQPERTGGLGLSLVELAAVFEAVGAQPLCGPLLETAVCLPLLDDLFRAAGLGAVLDDALDGRTILSLADPLDAPGCSAPQFDGERLRGTLSLAPFADEADGLVVAAGSGDRTVLLHLDRSDYAAEPVASLDPSIRYASVRFDLDATAGRLLASGPAARARVAEMLAAQRLMAAAELAGASAALTAMSVDYAKTRVQFGQPIGRFQAIQHMLATLAARSAALSSLAREAVRQACADPSRLETQAAIAFAYAVEIGRYAAEEAMQVHGGIGFTEELPLHLHYRRVLTHQSRYGEPGDLWTAIGHREVDAAA